MRQRQRRLDRFFHRLVNLARIAKAHLRLGRVHVDVDAFRRDIDEQQVGRLAATVQHVFVGRADGVADELVAHMAAVDVHVLLIGARARRGRRAGVAGDDQAAEVDAHRPALRHEAAAEHVAGPGAGVGAGPARDASAVVPEREGDVGPGQGVAAHGLEAMRQLGRLGLQELAPRRRGEKELAHLDAGAGRPRRRAELAAASVEPGRVRGLGGAAGERDLGDRGDGRERLAAKAHRRHAFQVGEGGDLARRVAAQGGRQLVGRNAVAVVFHDDAAHAAAGKPHDDGGGARVDRVVDQLAHHRRRPLDHLAGGDLAHQLAGQLADRPAQARLEDGIHGGIVGRPPRAKAGHPADGGAGDDGPTGGAMAGARRAVFIIAAMEMLLAAFDFVLHVDVHLANFVTAYGAWVYALLFAIIFVETGVVVMPFLPGDSLLFVVGAMCAVGLMSLPLVMALLWLAAVLGNQSNYAIGRHIGPRVFQWEDSRWFNRKAFDQAHAFYEKYGGITIVAARFMPFLRTFAPFVAGVARMTRSRFTAYDVSGGALWVLIVTGAGYLFGNIPWVKDNLDKIIWGAILIPGLLVFGAAWRARRKAALAT